uniref:REM-1 domain-containing protein n=1 Tax=Ditylenchus dipsaci TaxID=166011 RepID=A0A915EPP4_9BILA
MSRIDSSDQLGSDNDNGGTADSSPDTMQNPKLVALQRELAKEMKVKEGLERFLSLSSGNHLNPRAYTAELLESSKEMYEDNKAKIALLRMQIERIQMKEQSDFNGDNDQRRESKNDLLIADLMYRLRKEVALAAGAKNMLKILGEQKKPDSKSTKDAFETHAQAEEKIDLIRLALKKYTENLPPESPKRASVTMEINNIQSAPNSPYSKSDRFSPPLQQPKSFADHEVTMREESFSTRSTNFHRRSVACPPSLAVSGKLEIRLVGCQNLVTEVQGRVPRSD